MIRKKIANYMKLPGHFHVVFLISDSYGVPAGRYGESIIKILKETGVRRGSQFLVSPYDGLVNDPLGNWLLHYSGETYSLESVK